MGTAGAAALGDVGDPSVCGDGHAAAGASQRAPRLRSPLLAGWWLMPRMVHHTSLSLVQHEPFMFRVSFRRELLNNEK